MMHKKLIAAVTASLLCAALSVAPAAAQAPQINYNLPSAETIQKQKDSRRNIAVSERVGRNIMGAFELYSEQNDVKGAIAKLEEASPREAFDIAYVSRFLGNLYAANEQFEKALSLVKKAADADVLGWTDQAGALKLTADLSLQLERYDQALTYYARWLQFSGEYNPEVFLRIANIYYEQGKFDMVIKPADMAIQYYTEVNKNPYVLKVASYYERKMYADAIKVLETGLEVLPTEKTWWNQLGMMYMLEERIDKALQTLEIAYLAGYLQRDSQYRALVQLYSNNEVPYKAAVTMLKHLNAGDIEKTVRNFQNAASNFEAAKEYSRAAQAYGLAAEMEPERDGKAVQYRRQGNAYIRAQQYDKAIAAFRKALDHGIEEEGPVLISLSEAYFYSRNYADALKYNKQAQKFENQRRNARSWEAYIKRTASNRGVEL
jgi:tetratricopeptide (TPR) repeat protein